MELKIASGLATRYYATGLLAPVIIFDAATGSIFQRLDGKINNPKDIYHVKFSPDGTKLFTKVDFKKIQIWEVSSGSLLKTIDFSFSIDAFDISPDGTKILVGGHGPILRMYDATNGSLLRKYSGFGLYEDHYSRFYDRSIFSVKFSSDGNKIISNIGSKIGFWDINESSSSKILIDYEARVNKDDIFALDITPAGDKIISVFGFGSVKIKIWEDLRPGKTILDD